MESLFDYTTSYCYLSLKPIPKTTTPSFPKDDFTPLQKSQFESINVSDKLIKKH